MHEPALREFLVFSIGDRLFALASEVVSAVLASSRAVTPLPLVPDYVEGLINVNDRVLTLLDPAALFSLAGRGPAGNELLVVEADHMPFALRVDQVHAYVAVDDDQFRPRDVSAADEENIRQQVILGRIPYEDDYALLLDPEQLAGLLGNSELPRGEQGFLADSEQQETRSLQQRACLRFAIGSEYYAFNLADVVEVLDLDAVSPLRGAPECIVGVATVREDILLVLSLSCLLGIERDVRRIDCQVLVVELDGARYGLLMDRVMDIQSYQDDELRPVEDSDSVLSALLPVDDGLVGLIEPVNLLPDGIRAAVAPFLPTPRRAERVQQEVFVDVLEVRLGEDRFALPLEQVFAITEKGDFEALEHRQDSLVRGAVHIKGEILPVADYGALLHCREPGDASRDRNGGRRNTWVVVGDAGNRWAIPVEEVRQILRLPDQAVEPINDDRQHYLAAIARTPEAVMPVISLAPLQQSLSQ